MKYFERFRIDRRDKFRLSDIDPDFTGKFGSESAARAHIKQQCKRLSEQQELLYAEHRRSLLICLQAIDGGGKDGTISHVFGAMNPQGCKVHSFKKPVGIELDHDYMWRAYCAMPAKGDVAIFNRSYYEEVLVPRVHRTLPEKVIDRRYKQINAIEKHLSQNDTHILKFFLHISKDEQLKRFKDRLDNRAKHWKISEADYKEREYWSDYMEAFETMVRECSTEYAPWFVIPANHKWFRNLAVMEIVVEYLESLHMKTPKPSVDIDKIRKDYYKASRKK